MIITWSSHPVYLTLLSSARAARAPGTLRAAIGAVRISAIGCFCLLSKGYGMLHSDAVAATVLHQNFSRHCSYDNAQSKTNRGIRTAKTHITLEQKKILSIHAKEEQNYVVDEQERSASIQTERMKHQ
ncbi:hypothetical protein Y032_0755g2080 [Ancylostoma ceylanicum]|uniref:Uncharacterized protein n=1 Tax=Ancylostoma ceylanicum TaxID=53326 RepID=A0A016WEB3_9BILA|nr:hypothetical protein Y032_0755g2080 [Ancylostoma ceylanicum]